MSLVNQMLRDLESRQGGPALGDPELLDDVGAVAEPLQRRTSSRRRWLPALLLALLASLALAYHQHAPTLRAWVGSDAPEPTAFGEAGVVRVAARPESVATSVPAPATTPSPLTAVPTATEEAAEVGGTGPIDAPRAQSGLRLATALSAAPLATSTPSVPEVPADESGMQTPAVARTPPPASVGAAALPPDLAAVAARFDAEFDASPTAAAQLPPAAGRASMVKTPVPASEAEHAAEALARARIALSRGDPDSARSLLEGLLAKQPARVAARHLLANALVATGRVAEADAVLEEGLRVLPGDPSLAQFRARLLVEMGRDAEALAVLETVAAGSGDAGLLAFYAALMQRMGDHAGAADSYRRALAVQPSNGLWWMGLGISLEATGERDVARVAYRRARGSGGLRVDLLAFIDERLAAL